MKIFSTILLSLFFSCSFGQSTDFYTTFPSGSFTSGALVHLPQDYYLRTDSIQCIIFFSGTGQVGVDTSKIDDYGPHSYLRGGWDGGVQLANGKYYPIIISIQLPATFKRPWDLKILFDNIKAAYRIKTISLTGLSMGGWESSIFVTYQPTAGDHTYQNYVQSIVSLSSVIPSDTYGATPSYPGRFSDYALAGGKALITIQTSDTQADEANVASTMNAAVAGSATYELTTNGSGGHCCWDYEYGSATRTPRTHASINNQNVYQYMIRSGGDTTIVSPTRSSAGVYRVSDSVLLRTLWANKVYAPGTYPSWDGKDDYGNTISSPPPTYIKILSNNINYTWEGIIGNTSSSNVGSGVHRGYYTSMTGIAIAGTTAYFCQGYSEALSSQAKFSTATPQIRIGMTGFTGRLITMTANYVVTDGTYIYCAGQDGFLNSNSFVSATVPGTDAQVSFGANGVAYTVQYGKTYTSVIDKLSVANSKPTGIAVQQAGSFLFVSHGGLNELHVLNKTTGALVQNLSITNPRGLATEGSSLWMVSGTNTVAKYTINVDGTLTAATLTLSGIGTPGAIAANGGNLAVIDAGTNQIVRFYNTTTGTQGTQLGTTGGYSTSPDVTNTKFMFNDFRGSTSSFITFAPDGSFWVGDGGNYRELHFSAAKNYIETIMSMGATYSSCVDPNNITRVFGNYLEFAVDYSQPLTGSTGWSLVKNWGYASQSNVTTRRLLNVVTLSNGRTYGQDYGGLGFVELASTGLRTTTNPGGVLNADGSVTKTTGNGSLGATLSLTRYALTGFSSNNPVWSSTGTLLATTPAITIANGFTTPGVVSPTSYNFLTTTDKVIWYNPNKYYNGLLANPNTGYHLSAIKKGTNTVIWNTQRANSISYVGVFPTPEFFEIGNGVNQYAGSNVNVVDNNIITGYHGEFWRQGQTNWYNHYNEDGLSLGQFGQDFFAITGNQNVYPQPSVGFAGNALNPCLVKDGSGNLYLVHGDESYHAGLHLWKISGLNTITAQYISSTPNIPPVANAGADQSITLPVSDVSITGSGTDADGTISSYAWTKVSGTGGTITSPATAATTITGLSAGTYVYRLTVTDNSGASDPDDMTIVVSPAASTTITMGSGSGSIYFVNAGSVVAGDTICITPGTYDQISFDGLQGTLAQPIVIRPCGGVVTVTNNSLYCYRVVNSRYIHFTGTGAGTFYGFVATQPNPAIHCGSGINFKQATTDYEIDHYDSYNCENGFLCKIDPDDSTLNTYSNGWVIANVKIHDCRVRKTQGEGVYFTNTASTVVVKGFSGADTTVEPVKALNPEIYNNITDSTGWDGIQVAASFNAKIHNNSVSRYGWKNAGDQQAGILLGGKSTGSVIDNYINGGTGNGIQIFGYRDITVANNVIRNAGIDGTLNGQHSIFIDDRPAPSGTYNLLNVFIMNNTVVLDSAGVNSNYSIGIFNSFGTMNTTNKFYNNLLVQTGSRFYDIQGGAEVNIINNVELSSIAAALFAGTNDYHLLYGSPAINAGLDLSYYNITKDYDGVDRTPPNYDAGAYEFAGTLPPPPPVFKSFRIKKGKIVFTK